MTCNNSVVERYGGPGEKRGFIRSCLYAETKSLESKDQSEIRCYLQHICELVHAADTNSEVVGKVVILHLLVLHFQKFVKII